MRPGGTLAARFSTAPGASLEQEASSLGFPTGSLPQGGSGPFGNQGTSTGRMPPNGTLAAQLCDQSRLPFAVERDLTPSSMASTGQGDAQAGASLADRYAPARASSRTRNALLPHPAVVGHVGLYVLVLAMVGSGIGIAISADLFGIAFGGSGAPLPADFNDYAARVAHGLIATLLLALIAMHLAGWAYHQFFLRDRLISRMWFGKRS